MAFGDPYTFDELARTLRTTAPASLTLTAGQLLDLLDEKDYAENVAYSVGFDAGVEEGAASAKPKSAA